MVSVYVLEALRFGCACVVPQCVCVRHLGKHVQVLELTAFFRG